MLDPTRDGLLDTSEALSGGFHRHGFGACWIGLIQSARCDHSINAQFVDLEFGSAGHSVDAQQDGIDIGFAEIDIRAKELPKKSLSVFD